MSTNQDQKNHKEKINDIEPSLKKKKAEYTDSIKRADTPYSRKHEKNKSNPFFFILEIIYLRITKFKLYFVNMKIIILNF